MPFLRKYGTALAGATVIRIPMPKAGVADFSTGADWTPAAGDVKVSIDDGAEANIATLPTYSNGAWDFVLSNAELTGKNITVKIVDAAAKAVDDNFFIVETFGNASAMYPDDLGSASGDPLTAAVPGSYSAGTAGAALGLLGNSGTTPLKANVTQVNNVAVVGDGSDGNPWKATGT